MKVSDFITWLEDFKKQNGNVDIDIWGTGKSGGWFTFNPEDSCSYNEDDQTLRIRHW